MSKKIPTKEAVLSMYKSSLACSFNSKTPMIETYNMVLVEEYLTYINSNVQTDDSAVVDTYGVTNIFISKKVHDDMNKLIDEHNKRREQA